MESIDLTQYEKQKSLGFGGFAEVRQVQHKLTQKIYAAKCSLYPQITINPDETSREVRIMSRLNHPCILKFYGFSRTDFSEDPKPVLLLEYAPNQSLKDQMDKPTESFKNQFTPTKRLICFFGIASGMKYLHLQNVIHRDLKPGNILLDCAFFPKIADFGLSKIIHTNLESRSDDSNALKGTYAYMAPEVLRKMEYTFKCDVYAYGIMLFYILTGKTPFEGQKCTSPLDYTSRTPVIPEGSVPPVYANLIQRCLSRNPDDRPTFDEITYELTNNPEFLAVGVNQDEFGDYVNFLDEYFTIDDPEEQEQMAEAFCNRYNLESNNHSNTTQPAPEEIPAPVENSDQNSNTFLEQIVVNSDNPEYLFKYACQLMQKHQDAKAFDFLQTAAAFGHPTSQYVAGCMLLENDYGVPNHIQEGAQLIKLAADNGHPEAMTNYALLMFKGNNGVEKNIEEAVKYFKMAANARDPKGMFCYAKMLETGDGIPKNITDACRLYKAAADLDFTPAMVRYADLVIGGFSEEFSLDIALRYLGKAADAGDKEALQMYNQLNPRLQANQ